MSALPFLGAPLHWPPVLLALTALIIAPGVHLLLSPLLEGRKVTWRDDYAAVLVGDPLLAVAAGFAANVCWSAGPHGFPASWAAGCAWIAGGWATPSGGPSSGMGPSTARDYAGSPADSFLCAGTRSK